MTPDAGAQPGELSPADGSGPRELLAYRSAQGRWVVAAMIMGSSVAGIDSTAVAVALPAIGRNLHVGFQALQWTVTSYTLTLASLILLAGSLSDRWGRRRVFLAGLGWFTVASVLCAAAPGIGWLIAARAVQGIGGALMTPASLAIIEAAFRPGDRTRAIGTWAGFTGVSAAIAPFLGGWLTFVVNGALGGFAFVFIPALEIIAGYSPVVAGSALVPVTVMTVLLSGTSGRLAQRIGPRPPLVAGCLVCAVASVLAVRIGSHASYWTAVFPLAVLFGLGLASLIPPLTASAMNSAPDSLAGLASGVNNAVARGAGLLWIAALPPITGLIGAAYTDPAQFRSSFAQISWICAAAFACAAALAAIFITGPGRPAQAPRTALIQTPVPHLACPVAFGRARGQTRRPDSSPTSDPSRAADPPSPGGHFAC